MDSDIIYNGVVYNEMKGAFSNPDEVVGRECRHIMFKDTTYGVESGGDPKFIPELSYEEFKKADIKDNDIIINATPVGMYPNIFDINNSVKIVLTKHKVITIDLNYNPRISYFSYLSNCYINGIDMLIKQAVVANELITNQKLDNVDIESIANDINGYKNYCVIGMMGSGKTYFGKYYAKKNNLELSIEHYLKLKF